MARFIQGVFGAQQTSPPATALRVNTSLQGVPIPLLLGGVNRLAGNLIDYFNFFSQNAPSSGGGKGGAGAAVGKGQTGQYDYFASFVIGVCEGPIAEIANMWVGGSPAQTPSTGGEATLATGGFLYEAENFLGTYDQQPWSFTESVDAAHALAYRGIATANFGNYPLGSSPTLPNFTFEVISTNFRNVVPGQGDGDASIALKALLTDPHFGLGFPSFRLDALATWQSYCTALGFAVSPVIASSVSASSFINDLTEATNSAPCWQDGILTVIPYGDSAVTAGEIQSITETHLVPPGQTGTDPDGNPTFYPSIQVSFASEFAGDVGVTYGSGVPLTPVAVFAPTGAAFAGSPGVGQYFELGGIYYFNPADINQTVLISYNYAATASFVPNTTPIYDFTIDDFLANQGTIGSGLTSEDSPVICVRQSRDQMLNNIKVEYLDRTNSYNPVDIEVKDEASIIAFGRERPSDVKQLHFFCLAAAAQQSATLMLIRQQIARTFQFTVGRHFMLILELMALATITDPGQGLDHQPVRIIEIQENSDFSLTITVEEYLGTVSAPEFGTQGAQAFAIDYNQAPGPVNAPIIFEPTDELNQTNSLGNLQIWSAVSGQDTEIWGGCFVWASYDGENFQRVGQIIGPARMGVTNSALPAVTPNPTGGPTIDTADFLGVNLTESAATLSSGTQQDAQALNTLCYVGGELIAYATATLAAPNQYTLNYLVRGALGTEDAIASHPAGTPFARLDQTVFAFAIDQSRIGATITLKFQSFNLYQGGLQSLADCAPYPYQITGAALSSPLPNVTNLRTVFDVNTGFTSLDWDDISDFRPFKYEIRSGTSFASAVSLGQVAHPPFRVPGNGTYWVAAVSTPVPGLTVYSETWESVTIAGAVLTQNVVLTIDLKAANWPGTFTGGAGVDTTLNAIRSGGASILTDASILTTPDILDFGGGTSGMYFPSGIAFLDIGYLANASVSIQYQPTGIPVGQNILAIGDILGTPDILGSASAQFVTVYPMINIATAIGGDLYSLVPSDLYSYPDLYAIGDYNWGGFQRFSPGTYQARALDFAFFLETSDPNIIAYNLLGDILVTIPARVDAYPVTTSAAATTTITFEPTGTASPAPFNGGDGPSNLPAISWGIVNAQAGDDLIITALSLSSITFEILNAGAKVARNLTLTAEGF